MLDMKASYVHKEDLIFSILRATSRGQYFCYDSTCYYISYLTTWFNPTFLYCIIQLTINTQERTKQPISPISPSISTHKPQIPIPTRKVSHLLAYPCHHTPLLNPHSFKVQYNHHSTTCNIYIYFFKFPHYGLVDSHVDGYGFSHSRPWIGEIERWLICIYQILAYED